MMIDFGRSDSIASAIFVLVSPSGLSAPAAAALRSQLQRILQSRLHDRACACILRTRSARQRGAKAMARKMEVTEALEKLKVGLTNFSTSEDYIKFLKNQAKFHRYSPRNMWLILNQMPEASYVAGFTKWQSMGRSVKKGESGLSILSPVPFKKTDGDKVKSGMYFKMSAVF